MENTSGYAPRCSIDLPDFKPLPPHLLTDGETEPWTTECGGECVGIRKEVRNMDMIRPSHKISDSGEG